MLLRILMSITKIFPDLAKFLDPLAKLFFSTLYEKH